VSIWTTVPAELLPRPNIPVLSVGNLKGGVGKTTIAANLAVALVHAGIRVLAIDLDFQASLSVTLPPNIIPRHERADGGIHVLLNESYDMFHDGRITATGSGHFTNLSLVRTSFQLADVEDKLFAAFFLGARENDPRFALARKLADPRLKRDFDLVILDTPPRLTMASVNALCASTHVLIPSALTAVAQSGAVTFVEYLSNFREHLCPQIDVLGILPTFTRGLLSPAEISAIRTLQNLLPGFEIWEDVHIPARQDIANNRVLQNDECRQRFQQLAEKVMDKLGLNAGGYDDDHRTHRGSRFGWSGLSQ
jgi:chromosome partitioning protein